MESTHADASLPHLGDAQDALFKIGVALTSGLQMEEVLRAILDECRTVLPVDALYVALYDRAAASYRFLLFWDQGAYRDIPQPISIHTQHSLTAVVIARAATLTLADIRDPATASAYPAIKVADAPTRCYIGTPMIVRGQVIGVLSIQHLEPGAYSAEHIRLLEMIATQAAVAVENARLYALAQQELAERKRMQEALTAGEERLRLAIQATGAYVWDWNLQTGAVYFSEQWLQSLGFIQTDATASIDFWMSLLHPADRPYVEEAHRAHFAGELPICECEYRLRTEAGDYHHFLERGKVVAWDAGGLPLRMLGTQIDITRRKQAELEHALLARRLAMATEAGQVGIWEWDPHTDQLIWDQRIYAFYGLPPGTPMDNVSWHQMIHPDDVPTVLAAIQLATAEHHSNSMEFRIIRPDGNIRHILSIGGFVDAADDVPSHTTGVNLDITERRQMEEALRASEQRYRMLTENAQDMIWTVDTEGRFTYVSPAVQRLFGYSQEEAATLTLFSILAPAAVATVSAIIQQVQPQVAMPRAQPPEPIRLELEGVRKDGSHLWTESVATSMRDGNGWLLGLHGITRDVSQRHQQELQVRELNLLLEQRVNERTQQLAAAVLELQQANRLKDEFLAAVSHELRTPLTGILGIAEALELQVGGALNERQLHYIQTLRRSGDRLLDMVNSILRYTSLLAGKRQLQCEECRLLELGTIALRRVQARAEARQIKVVAPESGAGIVIVSDAEAVVDILTHLLGNAVKFTPEGGSVGLDLRSDDTNHLVQMIVWDTGIGISPDMQARIFAPLVQADSSLTRQYEGIGIGLAYVQRLVLALKGTIVVESSTGRGSRFTVTLPLDAT